MVKRIRIRGSEESVEAFADGADRDSVIFTHEVGHVLGLNHSQFQNAEYVNSVMDFEDNDWPQHAGGTHLFAQGNRTPVGGADLQGVMIAAMYVNGQISSLNETCLFGTRDDGWNRCSPSNADNQSRIQIRNNARNRCLEVSGSSSGSNIIEATCDGSRNQIFDVVLNPRGHFRITSRDGGLCLVISGNSNADGAGVEHTNCSHHNAYQNWTIHDVGNGTYNIRNEGSGRLLGANWSGVMQRRPNGRRNDQWHFERR
jgi:hypothetical protein